MDVLDTWKIYVESVSVSVRTVSVDAWTCVAWVNGLGEAGKPCGAQYRLAGTQEWTDVPASDIEINGGSFTAKIMHLDPQTSYQARVTSGDMFGEIVDFKTGAAPQLPNGDFEQWWLDKKIWCPWAENSTPYWGYRQQGCDNPWRFEYNTYRRHPFGFGLGCKTRNPLCGYRCLGQNCRR